MAYNEIKTKFLIEYDKANVTSSYPSLTDYEIATILDKAYLALIAQKITGNNIRRSGFETDIKSISDLQGLISTYDNSLGDTDVADNVKSCDLPNDFLYFVGTTLKTDDMKPKLVVAKIINHDIAKKFFETIYNKPWVKTPLCFIENGELYIVKDPVEHNQFEYIHLEYIKQPEKFTNANNTSFNNSATFECSDSMAEELVSLAIVFALENVESQRLGTKINTRGLEA